MTRTRLHLDRPGQTRAVRFRSAVSLHSHTMHSEEALDLLPRYVNRIPVVRGVFRAIERRYREVTGRPFDYSRAYWTPPLPAQAALAAEQSQIENHLGLAALVSLTDHDNIVAGTRLHVLESAQDVPISVEWTVPCGASFLHVGIHNLPPSRAQMWMREMSAVTRQPSSARIAQVLAGLNECAGTLIVLNHPLWDESGLGAPDHFRMVRDFLHNYGCWIHALEVNGLRPGEENRAVLRLARAYDYPAISGGDRHGSTPNTVLNLTGAATFSEFAAEVREGRVSEILAMPASRGPHGWRYAECALDIVREYPELDGRRRWMDRAFIREEDGSVTSLAAYWNDAPIGGATLLLSLLRMCHSRPLLSALRAALAVSQESPL